MPEPIRLGRPCKTSHRAGCGQRTENPPALTVGSVKSSGKERSYADPYIKKLGIKRVRELVAEQEADFAKAKVLRNVFTDSEGVAYNSVQWADDAV